MNSSDTIKITCLPYQCTGEENLLKDKFGNLVYDINSEDIRDPEKYPGFAKLEKKFIVTQNPGEIIFVPSGWHHQVHNMVTEFICLDLNLYS